MFSGNNECYHEKYGPAIAAWLCRGQLVARGTAIGGCADQKTKSIDVRAVAGSVALQAFVWYLQAPVTDNYQIPVLPAS